jgi:hypothetical protein
MISSATHVLSEDLTASMYNFRAQLEQQTDVQQVVDFSESAEKTETPQHPKEGTIDYEALKLDRDNRKDRARQAAVHTSNLQHQQNMVDTYIAASSDNSEQGNSIGINSTPVNVYQQSMDYTRNIKLINAFESVGREVSDKPHVSILV